MLTWMISVQMLLRTCASTMTCTTSLMRYFVIERVLVLLVSFFKVRTIEDLTLHKERETMLVDNRRGYANVQSCEDFEAEVESLGRTDELSSLYPMAEALENLFHCAGMCEAAKYYAFTNTSSYFMFLILRGPPLVSCS